MVSVFGLLLWSHGLTCTPCAAATNPATPQPLPSSSADGADRAGFGAKA